MKRSAVIVLSLLWPVYGGLYLLALSREYPLRSVPETFFLALVWLEAACLTPWLIRRVEQHRPHVRFGIALVVVQVIVNNILMWRVTGRIVEGDVPLAAAIAFKVPTSLIYGASIYAFTILVATWMTAASARTNQLARAAALSRDASRIELDLFRTRIDPELVSATLERIENEVDRDVVAAEDSTHRLADSLRAVLECGDASRRSAIPMTERRLASPHSRPIPRILAIGVLIAAIVIALTTALYAPWPQALDRFAWWGSWIVLVPLARWARPRRTFIAQALAFFAIAEAVRIVCRIAARAPFMGWRDATRSVLEFRSIIIGDALIGVAIVTAVALTALQSHASEAEAAAAREEQRVAAVRLAFLSEQLKPHFLFNALNGVLALMNDDAAAARTLLRRLRQFVATSFARRLDVLTTVADEMETAEAYAAIQVQRYDGAVSVQFDVEPAALDCAVPPFLLQPLIENAIQHGLAGTAPGVVTVRVHRDVAQLRVQVDDSGSGYPRGMIERVGIGNTRDRVRALFPDATFTLGRNADGGASVTVELPAMADT